MTDLLFTSQAPGVLGAEHFARLIEQLPVLIWTTDAELRITSRYGGLLARLGLAPGPANGEDLATRFANAATAEPVVAAHRAALRGESTRYDTVFQDRVFSAHVDPLHGPGGAVIGVVGFAFDVTDLRESEARLQTIIDTEPECVKLLDRSARLLTINPAGLAMIEAESLAQVVGQDVLSLVGADYRAAFRDLLERVFDGRSGRLEFEVIGLRGTRRWLDSHAVPLRNSRGEITALLSITRDVTERRRVEKHLQASRAALRQLATREQDIREDERTRIAREIHDSLGQALTALKLDLAAAHAAVLQGGAGLADRLAQTAALVDDLVKGVRRIATELRPPVLDELGLPAAIEWLARDFTRRTGIACKASVAAADRAIPHDVATALFRIVQESLTNVSRHAEARAVTIDLGVRSGVITLDVCDDGCGIKEADATGPGAMGILGMRERAAALGGVLEIGPRGGGGTRVATWLPAPPRRTPPQGVQRTRA